MTQGENSNEKTHDILSIAALVPTNVERNRDTQRWEPVKKETDEPKSGPVMGTRDAWEIPFLKDNQEFKHTKYTGDGMPNWLKDYQSDVEVGKHYVRIPGYFIISTSLDIEGENDEVPKAPEIGFERGARILGVELEDTNIPGAHRFYIIAKLGQTSSYYQHYLGGVTLDLTAYEDSKFFDEIQQSTDFDPESNEIELSTDAAYGTQYSHRMALGDALHTAYDRLKLMHKVLRFGYLNIAGPLLAKGATLTVELVVKHSAEKTVKQVLKIGTKKLALKAHDEWKQLVDPSEDDISEDTLKDTRVIQGTALYIDESRDGTLGFSGPILTVRSPTIESEYPHTLVIAGSGESEGISARYDVEVSGSLKAVEGTLPVEDGETYVTKNQADRIGESSASGTVWGGADGYRYDGEIEKLTVVPGDGAIVYVDGEQRAPDFSHAVVIQGTDTNSRAEYEIQVSGDIEGYHGKLPVGDGWIDVGLDEPDVIRDRTASGTVVGGQDGFIFSGEIESLDFTPPDQAKVFVDGQERTSDYPHTLVISGTEGGGRAEYEIEVTEGIRGYDGKLPAGDGMIGVGLDEPDEVDEKSVEGTVTGGADGYLFAGSLESLTVNPPKEAAVYLDGEPYPLDAGENEAPTAAIDVSPKSPAPGEEVTFDASVASDPDGTISEFAWEFIEKPDQNPFETASGKTVTRQFSSGTYAIRLTVTDDDGASDTKYTTLTIVNQPPTASFDANPPNPALDEAVTFDAGRSEDSDGTIASYQWEIVKTDGHESTPIETATGELFTHRFREPGTYSVRLTVIDDDGATSTSSQEVSVEDDKAITAKIEGPDGPVPVGTEVTFSGEPSKGSDSRIVDYEWLLERGEESTRFTGKTVTHQFSESGTYTVRLEVLNRDNVSATTSTEITVGEPPVARFDMKPDSPIEPHENITFDAGASTDPDGSIDEYEWEFHEKPTQNAETDFGRQVTRSFSAGTYAVTLTVRDDDGFSDSTTETLRVTPTKAPTARFEITPASPAADETVTFDASGSSDPDGSITSYEWEFRKQGDQNPDTASGVTVDRNFTSGEYAVTLTVTDEDGRTDSTSKTLTVAPPPEPPAARFDIDDDSPEPNETVTFDASRSRDPDGAIESYEWAIYRMAGGEVDIDPVASLTGQTPTYSFADSGTYTIELTVTDDSGTTDAASKSVDVNAPPKAAFDIRPSEPDSGEEVVFDASGSEDPDGPIVSYDWEFYRKPSQNPETDSGETVTRSFPAAEYAVVLTVTDDDGATDRTSKTLTVEETNRPPTASIETDTERVYVGQTISLDGSGSSDPDGQIVSYEWMIDSPVEKTIKKSGFSITYEISDEGTHQISLTVTDSDGETDTTEMSFMAREPPIESL